ncbi:UPF0481 protein [Nymphaea thermarum]|nr:UPF0481 protein [Nymphaea thermarum]
MCSKPSIFTMYEDGRAYKLTDPVFLSIGPYHARNAHSLEDSVLELVLQRTQISSREDVVNALRSDALEVRECYEAADILDFLRDDDEFVMALVRDGCFVIELIHIMTTEPHPFPTIVTWFSPTVFSLNNTRLRDILVDVLRVQNQIPMRFLQRLYSHLQYRDPPFEIVVNKFLNFYFMQTFEVPNLAGACHLLEAARMKFLPMVVGQSSVAGSATGASPGNFAEMRVGYSAIDLKDSGVTILPADEGIVKWDPRSARRPFLKLPRILINRDSDKIFKNMVAYEQRLAKDDNHPVQPVSSYLRLLGDLVVTAADARVLTVKGIIVNQLGSLDDIVNFFKDLKLGDTFGIDMLSKVRKDINTHCDSKWADLRRTYFRSPWSYCSLAAALILLILTFLQVLYAIRIELELAKLRLDSAPGVVLPSPSLTAADARVLTFRGIIDDQLGSLEGVVNFFKDLELGDTYGIDMLSKVWKDINTHCERKGISKWADLRRTYFRSPWSYCSLAAALILLILTLLQVLYAMLAYHLPKSN